VSAVQELVHVLEDAFASKGIEESGESQSMLGNLATVPGTFGTLRPPAASGRSHPSCFTSADAS
jgi:hypothetical protein